MSDRYKGAILSPTAPTVTPQSAGGIYTSSQQLQYQGQGVWPSAVNYPINNSLRFRSSASAYLNRTFSTPTNNKIWTWSGWVKRGKLADTNIVFGAGDGTSNNFGAMQFTTGDVIQYSQINSGSYVVQVNTSAVFRDPSAWYHVVLVYDSTNATSTDRIQIYVNGTRQSVAYTTGPFAQNTSSQINSALTHYISKLDYASLYFDGYLAEVNFIDGVALTPSSFGTTDAYGIWQPIPYTGAYGNNGFYLPFTDNSALTTSSNVGLGKDFSGNGNYWVTNNISITAGSTYDSMIDVPTNTNSNTANYATLNPLGLPPSGYSAGTFASGNLQFTTGGVKIAKSTISFPTSGKWYVECRSSGTSASIDWIFGLTGMSAATPVNHSNPGVNLYVSDTAYWLLNASSQFTQAGSISSSDVFQIAYDSSTGKVWLGKNNTYYTSAGAGTGNPSSGTNEFASLSTTTEYCAYTGGNTGTTTSSINFGQQPFTYTPPSGFYPLNTYNLPTPTILDGDQYFNATLYTGNSTTNNIVNAGSMQPDLVWIKSRSNAQNNNLFDVNRGAGYALFSNLTNAEANNTANFTSFNSNGFSLASNGGDTNFSGYTYVAWQWKANGSGSTNTAGSITSTVSANTTAGFSIVTGTLGGVGVQDTVGHGLGVAPKMIIFKTRSGATYNWAIYHASVCDTTSKYFRFTTDALQTYSTTWGAALPTSTVFGVTGDGCGSPSNPFVAYCFSAVAGYSAFGSYTGNGSSDGPFVYTGFRPKFVIVKNTVDPNNWVTFDSARNTYNIVVSQLYPNASDAEATGSSTNGIDFLSNGFKIRSSNNWGNRNGDTIIYMAFAENPFKIARAR